MLTDYDVPVADIVYRLLNDKALEFCEKNAPKTKAVKDRAALLKQHAFENYERATDTLQTFERVHGVTSRWNPESSEWKQAAAYLSTRQYQKALAKLEGLVVTQLIELQKMGLSGTGQTSCFSFNALH